MTNRRIYAASVIRDTWPFPLTSCWRGHPLTFKDDSWVVIDSLTSTPAHLCGYCGRDRTAEGHDGCLGTLSGDVMNACCGHGSTPEAYVQYWHSPRVAGEEALSVFREAGIDIPALHIAHKARKQVW